MLKNSENRWFLRKFKMFPNPMQNVSWQNFWVLDVLIIPQRSVSDNMTSSSSSLGCWLKAYILVNLHTVLKARKAVKPETALHFQDCFSNHQALQSWIFTRHFYVGRYLFKLLRCASSCIANPLDAKSAQLLDRFPAEWHLLFAQWDEKDARLAFPVRMATILECFLFPTTNL